MTGRRRQDLVLVGGGHAHVQVLKRLAMQPEAGLRVTLVVDQPVAIYSGMVPGWIAGDYQRSDLEIDTWPLARRCGARVVVARAEGLDSQRQQIFLEGRPPLSYDIASIDIGSTVAGLDTPGVREFAVASRPISTLLDRTERALDRMEGPRIRIVGGGAAGVELAFCLEARLRKRGKTPSILLVDHHPDLLRGSADALRRRVVATAGRRGIQLQTGKRVVQVDDKRILFSDDSTDSFDLLFWVTGAAPHRFEGDLPRDERGFIKVQADLSVPGCPNLFAVGDCASFTPALPKAGVYAVRQGPVLHQNLLATAHHAATRSYQPQSDFLALLNLGDHTAIGAKWQTAVEGGWVWRLKDRIDRKFMRMFQVLDTEDRPVQPMEMAEMPCGGCAAKVAQDELAQALAALPPPPPDPTVRMGVLEADDVAILAPGGPDLAWNLDAFMSLFDDPWWMGRIGAVNALSDLAVKGVQARWAMALVGLPEEEPAGTLTQVMAGAREVLDKRQVSLVGGHTLRGPGLQVGFTVLGPVAEPPLLQNGLQPGDRLILSRPIGTGVLFRADMRGEARGHWMMSALQKMVPDPFPLTAIARRHRVRAATDITGFGLAGHLAGMLRASGVSVRLWLQAVPLLEGVLQAARRGIRSTYFPQNQRIVAAFVGTETLDQDRLSLLFDPQTAGGILLGVPAEETEALLRALRAAGETEAAVIGEISEARRDGRLGEILESPPRD